MKNPVAIFLATNTAGRTALLRRLIGPGPAWTVLAVAAVFWTLAITVPLRPPGMNEPLTAMLWMYAALGVVVATLLLVPAAITILAATYLHRARKPTL